MQTYNTVKFVTAQVYSRGGCTVCRAKKIKCNEARPECLYCSQRGLECLYKPRKKGASSAKPKRMDVQKPDKLDVVQTDRVMDLAQTNSVLEISDSVLENPESVLENSESVLDLGSSESLDLAIISKEAPVFDTKLDTLNFVSPSSKTFLILKDKSFYIDYFYRQVATLLTISLSDKNYFQQLYSRLALYEDSFTYLVAAWSALYYNDFPFKNILVADSEVKGYLTKALTRFNKFFREKNTCLDYFFQIVFYLVIVQMILCYGGTDIWRHYFNKVHSLVAEYGGLEKFCSDLFYDRDARFIASSIQHLDILSSRTVSEGTVIPIDEYRNLFAVLKSQEGKFKYGVDPLQGTQQTIAFTMGDILNYKVMLERKEAELAFASLEDYPVQKAYLMKLTEQVIRKLETDLDNSCADWSDFPDTNDQAIIVPYLGLFEILKRCCQLYLELYIKKVTPNNYKIQTIVLEIWDLFEQLLPTKMCLILVLPLIVCGMCVYHEQDKVRLRNYADKLKKRSAIRNIEKARVLVERAFELNPTGETIVDWSKICDEFGWDLNVC